MLSRQSTIANLRTYGAKRKASSPPRRQLQNFSECLGTSGIRIVYINMCVYIYMYVCVYVCMYVCMYVCIYLSTLRLSSPHAILSSICHLAFAFRGILSLREVSLLLVLPHSCQISLA